MAEENEVTADKLTEPQQVTTKNLKKVEAGKRLAEYNHKKREVQKREEQEQVEKGGMNQYYGIGAVIAAGVIGGFGYYIYQTKKGAVSREVPNNPPKQPSPHPQNSKFEMD